MGEIEDGWVRVFFFSRIHFGFGLHALLFKWPLRTLRTLMNHLDIILKAACYLATGRRARSSVILNLIVLKVLRFKTQIIFFD
jgi:hypothetical protein